MTTNRPKETLKRWLNIEELEEEYSFNNNTQKRMRRLKLIPYSKVGKKIRYDRVLIDQWLENNSVGVQV